MLEVLGQLIALHLRQNGNETLSGVTNVGNEEQASIQAPQVVHTFKVVVSTAQHTPPRVVIRVHHGNMRIGSDCQP